MLKSTYLNGMDQFSGAPSDSGVLKLRSKNLAAVPDVYCRDDKGQNAAELVRERKVFQLEGGSGFED